MTIMKENKTVVKDKHHFGVRKESFSVTVFGKFGTIKILKQGSISTVFRLNPPLEEYYSQLSF